MVPNEDSSDQAHPFCIIDVQYQEEYGADAYVWSIQGLFDSNEEFKPTIKVKSEGKIKYCICESTDTNNMV